MEFFFIPIQQLARILVCRGTKLKINYVLGNGKKKKRFNTTAQEEYQSSTSICQIIRF
jgi:hypothetical protein